MEVLYPRCAGLDVHKQTVVAAVRIAEGQRVRTEVRRFATTTTALLALGDWLAAEEVTHVAMEATGVSWKPVWHVLEDAVELVLPTPRTSGRCRGGRATCPTRSGSPSCWPTG